MHVVYTIIALAATLFLLPNTTKAYAIEPTADQNQVSNYLFYAANDYGAKAQTFTTIAAGHFDTVRLSFAQTSGSESVPFVIEVQSVTAGEPDGTVLGTSDVHNATEFASVCDTIDFIFSTPVFVDPLTEYALVIIPTSTFGPSAAGPRWICGEVGGWAGGTLYNSTSDTSTWATEAVGDAYIYIEVEEGGGGGGGASSTPQVISTSTPMVAVPLFLFNVFGLSTVFASLIVLSFLVRLVGVPLSLFISTIYFWRK